MKTLQLQSAHTILKLTDRLPPRQTLTEQVRPFVERSPNLILDVEGILFTSMLIGELINVYRGFDERWKGQEHHISLVNLTEVSRSVFERVRLIEYFPVYDSIAEAMVDGTPPAAAVQG